MFLQCRYNITVLTDYQVDGILVPQMNGLLDGLLFDCLNLCAVK